MHSAIYVFVGWSPMVEVQIVSINQVLEPQIQQT